GNTALPDNTWSAWSTPLKAAPAKVASPRGRFIQIHAKLERASDPVLQSVSLYFQIQNQKPEVMSVTLGEKPKPAAEKPKRDEEKADASEEPEKKTEEPRPKAATPNKRIAWRADSKDGDILVYRLYFRAEGDDAWVQ